MAPSQEISDVFREVLEGQVSKGAYIMICDKGGTGHWEHRSELKTKCVERRSLSCKVGKIYDFRPPAVQEAIDQNHLLDWE